MVENCGKSEGKRRLSSNYLQSTYVLFGTQVFFLKVCEIVLIVCKFLICEHT